MSRALTQRGVWQPQSYSGQGRPLGFAIGMAVLAVIGIWGLYQIPDLVRYLKIERM
jgi:hypothetical protein